MACEALQGTRGVLIKRDLTTMVLVWLVDTDPVDPVDPADPVDPVDPVHLEHSRR